MRRYKVGDLALMLGTAVKICTDLATSDKLQQPICDDKFCKMFVPIVEGLLITARNFDADPALIHAIEELYTDAKNSDFDRREAVLYARLKPIVEGIQNNLNSRAFMFIESDRAEYWENGDLFGQDFAIGFPKAALIEMLEAGDCFAAGRATACVFHCIRIAEYGLRLLAKMLKVSVSDKGKTHPLEYADWDKVITAIRNKITDIRKLPRGPKKEKSLQYYSGLANQCEYMKDIWRNEIMHTRRLYNDVEALSVIGRVRDFVQPIASIEAKKRISKGLQRMYKLQKTRAGSLVSLVELLQKKPGSELHR
jgi:hypothetical protein